jgi:thiamine-phosphate pyrophosphorylase
VDSAFPRLHVVTDTRTVAVTPALTVVRAAVAAAIGAPGDLAVQVRVEDHVTDREAYALALAIVGICQPAGVMCLVNDRAHVALAIGADGCHVGADDLPPDPVRRLLGDGAIVGVTCRNADDGRAAAAAGATYLGVGPAFVTGTKDGLPEPIGPAGVGAVARGVPGIPVIAIGGVTVGAVRHLRDAGAWGVAVVGALSSAADPERAAVALLKEVTA